MPILYLRSVSEPRDAWRFKCSPEIDPHWLHSVTAYPVIHRGPYTRLLRPDTPRPLVLKLIRARRPPRDHLRKYLQSEARRAHQATGILRALGLRTPRSFGYGISLSPWAPYESLGITEYLPQHLNARRYLMAHRDPQVRRRLLLNIAADVATIYSHRWHHKDCHLGNIIVGAAGLPVWVDSELRAVRSTRRLLAGLAKTLIHLRRSAEGLVDEREWAAFTQRCTGKPRQAIPKV